MALMCLRSHSHVSTVQIQWRGNVPIIIERHRTFRTSDSLPYHARSKSSTSDAQLSYACPFTCTRLCEGWGYCLGHRVINCGAVGLIELIELVGHRVTKLDAYLTYRVL